MALPAVAGNTIMASDLYQLCQPAGATEKGAYYIDSWSGASGDEGGNWAMAQSRGATPVSVSIDTSISGPTTCNSPSTNLQDQYGFHVFTSSTAAAVKFFVGGVFTIQY